MQKKYRLKRREDFRQVFRTGRSIANREFVVYSYVRKKKGPTRIGISVSKRVGNAVVRNRIKRLIKEITRHWVLYMPPHSDIVLIVRKPVAKMNFHQVKSSLRHVFVKTKVLNKSSSFSEKDKL